MEKELCHLEDISNVYSSEGILCDTFNILSDIKFCYNLVYLIEILFIFFSILLLSNTLLG